MSGDWSGRLAVGHDRLLIELEIVIDVYEVRGRQVCSFGEETLRAVHVLDNATGFDGQIFVLKGRPTSVFNNDQIALVFTKDGHQQDEFKINREDNVYCCLACHLRGEQIVFAGFEWKSRKD